MTQQWYQKDAYSNLNPTGDNLIQTKAIDNINVLKSINRLERRDIVFPFVAIYFRYNY